MPPPLRHPWRNAVVTAAVLVPVIGFVIWSSFQVSEYQCELCMSFEGRDACRTVAGKTEEDAMRGALNNTCAQLSSGVTDTLRCERTTPRKLECRELKGS